MHRAFASDAEIERIAKGVEEMTLPKAEWTHAAHWAAALFVLRHGKAWHMRGLIMDYNEATGVANTDTDGYHETITLASMRAAGHWLREAGSDVPLHRVANALLQSDLGRSTWLLDYWKRETLFSVAARRAWVAPDIQALPYAALG